MNDETKIDTDEDLDELFESLEMLPAQLTLAQMNLLEQRWKDNMLARRMALTILTKPFSEFRQLVETDRDFAEAVASTYTCVDGVIEYCRGVAGTLEASRVWMMVALAGREDMEEVIEAGKAAVDEGAAA